MGNSILISEGLFDQYICDQDYTPKWTPIEPISSSKALSVGKNLKRTHNVSSCNIYTG